MSSTRHEQHRAFMQHHLDRAMDDDSDATTMNPPPTATTPHPPSSITTKPPSAPTTTENSTERHCERSARIANQVNRSRRFGTNRYDVNESDDDDSVDVINDSKRTENGFVLSILFVPAQEGILKARFHNFKIEGQRTNKKKRG